MDGPDTDDLDAGRTTRSGTADITVTLVGGDLRRARLLLGSTASARRAVLHLCEHPSDRRRATLLDAGVALLVRQDGDGAAATVVLRPCRLRWDPPRPAPPGLRRVVDWRPDSRQPAASLTEPIDAAALHPTPTRPRRLFSPTQHALLDAAAPGRPGWADLRAFGPVALRSWPARLDELALTATLWTPPAPCEQLLELHLTAPLTEAALVVPTLVGRLRGRGFDPDAFRGTAVRAVLAVLAGVAANEPG